MKSLILGLLWAMPWSQMDEEARAAALSSQKQLAVSERMVAASSHFLGTRYQLSPLGEGQGKDADPLLRWDAVDCVTMVEETMAVALSDDEASVLPTLNRIRYDGEVAWEHRKHIMEAQWLPLNVQAGLLRDVAREYAGPATVVVKKVLDEKTWSAKAGQGLFLTEAQQPRGEFSLNVIPPAKVLAALKKAPSGLILAVVRADRPAMITRVSHVGILVQGPKGPMLRHASKSYQKVVDEPLAVFLKRNLDFAPWTISGIGVYEVLAPQSPMGERPRPDANEGAPSGP